MDRHNVMLRTYKIPCTVVIRLRLKMERTKSSNETNVTDETRRYAEI